VRGVKESPGARRQGASSRWRERYRIQHVLDQGIVWVEDLAGEGLRPAALKDALRRFDLHIEVDQRPTAHATGLEDIDVFEAAVIEQAAILVIPEGSTDLADGAGKIGFAPTSAALQHTDGAASLG
jgi:hypothetical protein